MKYIFDRDPQMTYIAYKTNKTELSFYKDERLIDLTEQEYKEWQNVAKLFFEWQEYFENEWYGRPRENNNSG